MVIGKLLGRCNVPASADPDLEIRGMGRSKKVFLALRATVWSKNKGGGPPGPLPWI